MKQISSALGEELNEPARTLATAVAQSQHHDSITGTEKQHVSDDYALYLDEGVTKSQDVLTAAYRYCVMCMIVRYDIPFDAPAWMSDPVLYVYKTIVSV